MAEQHDIYFKIGEFAKICGVKKATLIHYAKVGLLCPHHMGDNGYFYYHPSQIFNFEVISILRGMNIPLEEIRDFQKSQSLDNCHKILRQNLSKLREYQQYLEGIGDIVENTLQEIDAVKKQVLDTIEIVELTEPTRFFVYEMPYRTENCAYDMKNARMLIQHCQQSFINKSIAVTGIILEKDILNGSFAKTYGAFKANDATVQAGDQFIERPAGTYLTMCARTGGDEIIHIHRQLKAYADAHGYRVFGNAFEDDQLSHIVELDRSNYLVRCYLQIDPSIAGKNS